MKFHHEPNKMVAQRSPGLTWMKELYTYISRELLEGVEHVEAVKVNNSSCQCFIVPVSTEVKRSDSTVFNTSRQCHFSNQSQDGLLACRA